MLDAKRESMWLIRIKEVRICVVSAGNADDAWCKFQADRCRDGLLDRSDFVVEKYDPTTKEPGILRVLK